MNSLQHDRVNNNDERFGTIHVDRSQQRHRSVKRINADYSMS
jgi:hypothetical protein